MFLILRKLIDISRGQRGQILVLAVGVLIMSLGVIMISVDVGWWLRDKRDAQNDADAIALAAVPGAVSAAEFGPGGGGAGGPLGDAASALVNLGYRRAQAFGVVASAARRLGAGTPVEELIRSGLSDLGAAGEA